MAKKRKKIQPSNRLQELHRIYFAVRMIQANPSRTLLSMLRVRLLPTFKHLDSTPLGPANAIQTVPTGFSMDPPDGPATPEVAKA